MVAVMGEVEVGFMAGILVGGSGSGFGLVHWIDGQMLNRDDEALSGILMRNARPRAPSDGRATQLNLSREFFKESFQGEGLRAHAAEPVMQPQDPHP